MGVCNSSNKNRKTIIKAQTNKLDKKNKKKNNNENEPNKNNNGGGVIITSRTSNHKTFENLMEKMKKKELRRYNTNGSNHTNKTASDINSIKNIINSNNYRNNQSFFQNFDTFKAMNAENILMPIPLTSHKNIMSKNDIKSLKSFTKKDNNNFNINDIQIQKEYHSKNSIKVMDTSSSKKDSNINNNINTTNSKSIKNNDYDTSENDKNKINEKFNENENININNEKKEQVCSSNKNELKNIKANDNETNSKNKKEENVIKELNEMKKTIKNELSETNENKNINENKNTINNENNVNELYEDDDSFSNITFFKEINCSNLNNISMKKNNKINNNNINNNYHLFKGNLFNLNIGPNSDSTEETNSENKDKCGLYYFSEFRFTQNKNYSSEKDFNNLLNSQIFQNKIILANRLLNLQERQWYKESISLSDSLKINRENTYLDGASFNHYLNKIINLYNHFNWLVWALSYYYCNSLLFNKNHWFNAKNSNLPAYDNLEWIRGFEWKGLYIKVQTYNESKKIIKEVKALQYAFLDYLQVIDNFKYKTNINKLNLLSNEIIFPFMSYIYFGGIFIYVSATIKKYCYEDNNNSILEQSLYNYDLKRENMNINMNSNNNSNTKCNTNNSNRNTFDNKDKQFDDISVLTVDKNNYSKININENMNINNNINIDKNENKNFLKFKDDYISLNDNLINNDINISGYSKIDLKNSKILCNITENNFIKVIDDINSNCNINSEKYKYLLTNIYALLPDLIKRNEIEKNLHNVNYIKFKNSYQSPKIYELSQKDMNDNELNNLNKLLDEPVNESNINIYQNNLNGIDYRIIYQTNNDTNNEKITNFFVKLPFIQNRKLSEKIINQYVNKKNSNFLMHNFQIKYKQEITDNNVLIFKTNLQPKMKCSIIAKENESLNIEQFHSFINNICENLKSYKLELRNVDNLLNFCEKYGLNTIFLPFIVSKIKNKNISNLIKIYLFSNIIKKYYCYNQCYNLLLKLSIYEACKDKDILNSNDKNIKDNNMIEIQRTLLINIIKFFLLPSQYIDSITSKDHDKESIVNTLMENLSFFTFMHSLKVKRYEKVLNFSQTFLSKMNIKEIINEYALICRNNPFLFIDTLEKLINFRMNPYLKYKASLDVQNLRDLKKDEIVIFAPKINSFIDLPTIAGYIFAKSVGNNNPMNMSLSNNNLLLSYSNFNVTAKIGKFDSYMMNNFNSKCNNNNNNITRRNQEDNDDDNITISNNGIEDLSSSIFGSVKFINKNNQDLQSKNKSINNNKINNNNIIVNENKTKNKKLSFKNILNYLLLDNFLPPKINKTFFNNNQNVLSKYLTNNYYVSNEEILVDYNNNIEKILGEIISYNGSAEMIIFKSNIHKIIKSIFFTKNLKQAKEIIHLMKEKFEKQYLFTFNQCSVIHFLESLTFEKFGDSQDFYSKTLIFALFNLGDVRCNNCNGHPFLLLPLYILCKITGYLEGSDTNEYFKEMFRCLNFKINKNMKLNEIHDDNIKKLLYFCFPSVSDLKSKTNEFFYEKDFLIFLINSLLNFFYSGDNLLIDNDFLSYNRINFKISKSEEDINKIDTSLINTKNIINDNNNNSNKSNQSNFILDILLDKMSYLKYGPSNIIVSFGNNKVNQTSHDNYDMLTLPRLVYKICDLKIKKIFSGYNYNFVIDNENNVYSWGDNADGQCGLGDKKIIKSPKQVFFPELMDDDFIENIFCGNNSTYFISNKNKLFLCGYNIILKKKWCSPNLLEIDFDSNLIQIKSGEDFTLFLTESGNVYSMGSGSEGQLGVENILNYTEKFCQNPTKILSSIKQISCGNKHSFAISYNGKIFCWGKNNKGQLGLNYCEDMKGGEKKCNELTPVQLEEYLDDIEIKDIICGKNFTFFQTKNNDLLGCGNNDKEQLGIQDYNNNLQNSSTKMCNDYIIPTEIEQFTLLKVMKIVCGEEHCLAIIKDTISNLVNIWCWGSNNLGQIGLGSHVNFSKPKPNHYLLEFINHEPIDISVGNNHSIILLQRKDYDELNKDETLTELIFKYSKI